MIDFHEKYTISQLIFFLIYLFIQYTMPISATPLLSVPPYASLPPIPPSPSFLRRVSLPPCRSKCCGTGNILSPWDQTKLSILEAQDPQACRQQSQGQPVLQLLGDLYEDQIPLLLHIWRGPRSHQCPLFGW